MGFRRFQKEHLKVCKAAPFGQKEVRLCTLLGALSGIGGNPTFCADYLVGDFGSVARTEIHKLRAIEGYLGPQFQQYVPRTPPIVQAN